MAKVKYRIREFKPTANQTGGHSVYAEAVVDNIITNKEPAVPSGDDNTQTGGGGTTGGELEG